MRLLLLLAAVALVACDPFAPNESHSRTVEGCSDAVAHLRSCCPAFDSYVSCTYLDNAIPSPDLSESQSRCLTRTPCPEIERAVAAGRRVCSFAPVSRRCR